MMKFAEVAFGRTGAKQYAVLVGETAKNFKGFRYNASAGSLQLRSLQLVLDAEGNRQKDDRGYWLSDYQDRKPAPIKRDALVRYLEPGEFLKLAAAKGAASSYRGRLSYSDAYASLEGEVNKLCERFGPVYG